MIDRCCDMTLFDALEMMAFLAGCHPDAEAIFLPPYEDRNHDSGMEP